MVSLQTRDGRLMPNAGIAIGPILFIIAILAILAAAIAAGSGSFTSGTSSESNRTKSSALIQIGENLKIGMDRITMEGGLDPSAVNLQVNETNTTSDLFSPTGGGIAPPSVGMANDPTVDKWYFAEGPIQGLGTGGNNIIAVLPVSQGVCQEINNRSIANATTPTSVDLGNFIAGPPGVVAGATWTTTPPLVGVATGCVLNGSVTPVPTTGPSTNYFFYQVLAIQ